MPYQKIKSIKVILKYFARNFILCEIVAHDIQHKNDNSDIQHKIDNSDTQHKKDFSGIY